MTPMVMTKAEKLATFTAMLASAAFTAPGMILFKGNPVLNEDTVIGDLTQPTGSWYAAGTAVFSEIYSTDGIGTLAVSVLPLEFDYTGSDPSETITGWAVTNTAGSTLLLSGMLDSPVVMGSVLDSVITPVGQIKFPTIKG